jgi:ribosomal small subunit protein bTHX
MGRGDRRTKKGKITKGSFGNARPKNKKTNYAKPVEAVAEEVKSEE